MKLEIIIEAVEQMTNVTLRNETRKRNVVYTRFIYFKLAKVHTKHSLEAIGKMVDRDHASVLYGIRSFDNIIVKYEPEYYEVYKLLDKRLRKSSGEVEKITNPTMYYRSKFAQTLLELRETRNQLRKVSKDAEGLKKQLEYLL